MTEQMSLLDEDSENCRVCSTCTEIESVLSIVCHMTVESVLREWSQQLVCHMTEESVLREWSQQLVCHMTEESVLRIVNS